MAEDKKDESSGIRQKSKFVHVPMYQVSVDTQEKGKLLTARRKTRWIFGYANYDALKRKCKGELCRGEEHEIELHSSVQNASQTKMRYRVFHNGRQIHEVIISNTDRDIFEYDFTLKGKNHESKLVAKGAEEPDLNFGGLPFRDLPKTFEIQRNILSLYVAVPRKKTNRPSEKETRYRDGKDDMKNKKNELSITPNKQPKLHELLNSYQNDENVLNSGVDLVQNRRQWNVDEQGSERRSFRRHSLLASHLAPTNDAEQEETSRRISQVSRRSSAPTSDSLAEAAAAAASATEYGNSNRFKSHDEPKLERAFSEEWIQANLFLSPDQVNEADLFPAIGTGRRGLAKRSNSFVSVGSTASNASTIMSLTDNEADDEDGGSYYLDRSTRSMFDSSEDSASESDAKSKGTHKMDGDDLSVASGASSFADGVGGIKIDDLLENAIQFLDDDSSSDDDQANSKARRKSKRKSKGEIPHSITTRR